MPTDEKHGEILFYDYYRNESYYYRSLRLKADGTLCFINGSDANNYDGVSSGVTFAQGILIEGRWAMVSVTQTTTGNVTIYLNGNE